MTSIIKTLRASGSQLQADVVIGSNQWGSDVAVQVRLDRRDPELEAALAPLVFLLSARAEAFLEDAAVERRVQARVRIDVDRKVKSEKERLARNAQSRVDVVCDRVKRIVGDGTQSLEDYRVKQLLEVVTSERSTSVEAVSA